MSMARIDEHWSSNRGYFWAFEDGGLAGARPSRLDRSSGHRANVLQVARPTEPDAPRHYVSVAKLPRRTIVMMVAATALGIALGVLQLAKGNSTIGVVLIVASLVGPPGSLVLGKWALDAPERRHR